ncbi:MAG TPA: bacteriohemerythrin [Patescibacteria group bacterium]|nr:bacteriohemerythrin [Patescibacteria group bacterium]
MAFTYVVWNPRLAVGNSVIDYDHQMLINLTNEACARVLAGDASAEEITLVFDRLVEYAHRHFAREEELFRKAEKYPAEAKQRHVTIHRELERLLGEIAVKLTHDPSLIALPAFSLFLQNWLIQHIQKYDFGYRHLL